MDGQMEFRDFLGIDENGHEMWRTKCVIPVDFETMVEALKLAFNVGNIYPF